MGYPSQPPPGDWDQIRSLESEIKAGRPVSWDDELLRRVGGQVGLTTVQVMQGLQDDAARSRLALEMAERIRDGSRRLSSALVQANNLQQAGKFEEAKQALQTAAAETDVPYYREIAESEIIRIDEESRHGP